MINEFQMDIGRVTEDDTRLVLDPKRIWRAARHATRRQLTGQAGCAIWGDELSTLMGEKIPQDPAPSSRKSTW